MRGKGGKKKKNRNTFICVRVFAELVACEHKYVSIYEREETLRAQKRHSEETAFAV